MSSTPKRTPSSRNALAAIESRLLAVAKEVIALHSLCEQELSVAKSDQAELPSGTTATQAAKKVKPLRQRQKEDEPHPKIRGHMCF